MDAHNAKKTVRKFIAPIDPVEVAVRIFEAGGTVRRPPGMTAQQAIDTLQPQDREDLMRAASAVLEYISQCIRDANQPS